MRLVREGISRAFDLRSLLGVGTGVYANESGVKPPHSKARSARENILRNLLASAIDCQLSLIFSGRSSLRHRRSVLARCRGACVKRRSFCLAAANGSISELTLKTLAS